MTGDGPRHEWAVVLEFVDGVDPFDHQRLAALVRELRTWHGSALCASDRYAIQIHVVAGWPNEALRLGVELHDQAVRTLHQASGTLVRAEVMTLAEIETQRLDFEQPMGTPAPLKAALSDEAYRATRALFRATTSQELIDILVDFVDSVGGEVQLGSAETPPGRVGIDMTLDGDVPRRAIIEPVSISGLMIEQALPALLADARAVQARF